MRKEFVHYTSRKVKGASRSIQVAKKIMLHAYTTNRPWNFLFISSQKYGTTLWENLHFDKLKTNFNRPS